MDPDIPQFDPVEYKKMTRRQWQATAEAWYRWSPTLNKWLGNTTEKMLALAGITNGQHILDIAAGAGEQSIMAANKVGVSGYVLATDISSNILAFAKQMAQQAGINNIETKVMDGENLTLEDGTFDAVISRVGLIYFPDQQKALKEMLRVLKPGGRMAAIVYSTPERNKFFSVPVSIIRNRAKLPPPLPGQPGPFSLGTEGVIEKAFSQAGFKNIKSELVEAPLLFESAKECLRFEKESFGALHQMMSGLSEQEKEAVWEEIEIALQEFQTEDGFLGPCEMLVAVGEKRVHMG
ncbi:MULTISPECIES: class I SAM-dependent methyltransferase [unclassified Pedobacter]|uniref:class I SAM-dependent methyltransferase n=1 Tax=unclassified Pedobacter TaxID=2628915 RepID=UPI001DDABA32|nr:MULTISPECIES: class I SAM-dependent methyltransferase [unclassified Pedobacter]CAH0167335.1 Ubiquinone/menaquinone biosynthesis C-methyltransferase UbiE [Pedobacter sp. Bi126]CAH0285731.1 Ubiquinone/menaquinone biosynthesis C-methyltransferase UbiE [Pedobacter sp. Bi36]